MAEIRLTLLNEKRIDMRFTSDTDALIVAGLLASSKAVRRLQIIGCNGEILQEF